MRYETCGICWRKLNDPVTLTDVDGATMTVCRVHTMSSDEVLSRVEAYLSRPDR